jgi:YfiR/HmsC-like
LFVNFNPIDLKDSGFDHGLAKCQIEVHLAFLSTNVKKTLNDPHRLRASMRRQTQNTWSLQAAYCSAQICAVALAVLLSVAAATFAWAQANPAVEYQVKAAFLHNFTKFVEWPAAAFQGEKSPIILCVFKHDPFGSALDEVIRRKTINNREVLARRISELPDLKYRTPLWVDSEGDR